MFGLNIELNSKTLNCVLVGFIIALAIVMIVNYIKRRNEQINESKNKNKVLVPVEKENKNVVEQNKCQLKYDTNELEDDNTMLARDIVVGRKLQQEIQQEQFLKEEIDGYFNDHMNFYDKVNFDSNNNHDVVEKIGEYRLDNTELTKNQGKTIGEVFDNYTKNQNEALKKCKNPQCVIPGGYDDLMQRKVYKDSADTYANFHTRYETDGVNNGGKFFDQIEGHDGESSRFMTY